MKRFFGLILVLMLSACVSNGIFHGKSVTYDGDNILRNDIYWLIMRYQRALGCNQIDRIDTEIVHIERVDGRFQVEELWHVDACKSRYAYPVFMREDEKGETDFTVRM